MTTRDSKPIAPTGDWYLREWLVACDKRQVDLEKELDWNKSKASLMMRATQKYTRDEVNQIAAWLEIEPYELLMPPEKAMAIRRMHETALAIVKGGEAA